MIFSTVSTRTGCGPPDEYILIIISEDPEAFNFFVFLVSVLFGDWLLGMNGSNFLTKKTNQVKSLFCLKKRTFLWSFA